MTGENTPIIILLLLKPPSTKNIQKYHFLSIQGIPSLELPSTLHQRSSSRSPTVPTDGSPQCFAHIPHRFSCRDLVLEKPYMRGSHVRTPYEYKNQEYRHSRATCVNVKFEQHSSPENVHLITCYRETTRTCNNTRQCHAIPSPDIIQVTLPTTGFMLNLHILGSLLEVLPC